MSAPLEKEESVIENTTVAVDLAKNVFEVAVSRLPGRARDGRSYQPRAAGIAA